MACMQVPFKLVAHDDTADTECESDDVAAFFGGDCGWGEGGDLLKDRFFDQFARRFGQREILAEMSCKDAGRYLGLVKTPGECFLDAAAAFEG